MTLKEFHIRGQENFYPLELELEQEIVKIKYFGSQIQKKKKIHKISQGDYRNFILQQTTQSKNIIVTAILLLR